MAIANQFEFGHFKWWIGVVEDRGHSGGKAPPDSHKIGRVKVRIFGYHTKNRDDIDTDELMWAVIMMPVNNASISGLGHSPTGIVEGTHVIGFFLDGENAQSPIIMGTILGVPEERNPDEGFHDPNDVYPRNGEGEFWNELGEADSNRLSRSEKINDTIIQKKLDEIDTAQQAFGGEWKEKATEYAAEYPYNHVYETESGHIREYDDTDGAERISEWHRSGTFYEIHPEGDKVEKIVKDKYFVLLGDDYCHIHGDCRVTIQGNAHILIDGDANLEIKGDKKEKVHGNSSLEILGVYNVQVNGRHHDNSDTHRIITAPRIDLNP